LLRSHVAADFFTVDAWTTPGLVIHYVLFVVHHATRTVHIAGITPHPNSACIAQVTRNLTGSVDGFLRCQQFLILDNDTLFAKRFHSILEDAGGVRRLLAAIQDPARWLTVG
jgi:hypothetical protein